MIADVGDGLWYEYDVGDAWDHVLKVEKVLPQPPSEVQLLTGKRACPPEDVGGIGRHAHQRRRGQPHDPRVGGN